MTRFLTGAAALAMSVAFTQAAFADARTKAELYATAAGGSLDDIVSISEAQGYNNPQPFEARAMAAPAPQKDVPVEAGELTFAINVSVQWELDTNN